MKYRIINESYRFIQVIVKIFTFLLIFLVINFQVETKNFCNDDCLTKTYCISSDGSSVCSNNNLVTAQFKVIPVFGEYDYLQITLKGYDVAPDDEKTIQVSFDRPNSLSNIYSCYKSSLGATYASFIRKIAAVGTGSSYYEDSILYCSWTFNFHDDIWPEFKSLNVDMIADSSQSITLYHGSQKVQVAEDTSQLPIYKAQYLKCCNKVHGNDAFLLSFDQIDKQIRYKFYNFQDYSNRMTLTLTRKDGIKLQFDFDFYAAGLSALIKNGTKQVRIDKQLIKSIVMYKEICSWATPFVLGDSELSIDVSTSFFDLNVQEYNVSIYAEKDVVLNNSSCFFEFSLISISNYLLNLCKLILTLWQIIQK